MGLIFKRRKLRANSFNKYLLHMGNFSSAVLGSRYIVVNKIPTLRGLSRKD